MTGNYPVFFGDIHNHNALGYGKGSLERSIDIARTHLDFFAFTGHAGWHDILPMEGDRQEHWLRGFKRHNEAWPNIQNLVEANNQEGEFVQFLGYEWHSTSYGDHCVVFPDDRQELYLPDNLKDLRYFCRKKSALMIPHHLAYAPGNRGVNWDVFDPSCTPVVEIYSEHGNSEFDRGPFPFFTHSYGGRVTANTAQAGLKRGHKFGFAASSDNHRGFPGAFGEGIMGVLAEDLTREAIFRAVHARRTYAITGDRIELQLRLNGKEIGEVVPSGGPLECEYAIDGRDELELIEVVHNGRTVHRLFPEQPEQGEHNDVFAQPVQLRFEWGWGPWKDLSLDRITDWEMTLDIRNGRLTRFFPCLQSGPFSEEKRHRFLQPAENKLEISSYTSRMDAYRENPNQSVLLEISGDPNTKIEISMQKPTDRQIAWSLGQLYEGACVGATGPFPRESFLLHRLVPSAESSIRGSFTLSRESIGRGTMYFRIRQRNGQMAWSSPWFLK